MRILLFCASLLFTSLAGFGQDYPDLAVAAVRQAGPKVKTVSITRNNKAVGKFVKDGDQWRFAQDGDVLDTLAWLGWDPIDPALLEVARYEGMSNADDRVTVYRAPKKLGDKTRTQKLFYDLDGKIHRVVWLNVNTGGSVRLADADYEDALLAEFFWTGRNLGRFVNYEQQIEWNFKYDRSFRLIQVTGTEAGKKVTYRFTYK